MKDLKHLIEDRRESYVDLRRIERNTAYLWGFVAGMMFFGLLDMFMRGITA